MNRQRVILAANARPRDGGLGLNLAHMVAGLVDSFAVEVFCAGPDGPADGALFHAVPPPDLALRVLALPGLRRFRGLTTNVAESRFDQRVARALPDCRVFQGLTGQCDSSLRRARELGARTLLDVVTVHNDEGDRRVARECAAWGVPFHPNRTQGARRHREYAAANLIRVMSHHARRTFLENGCAPERVVTLHPPIEVEQFPQAAFRHDRFRVSFVGRLEIGKAFHHAVEAFQQANLPDSELVLWGGSGSREVSRYLRERVASDPRIHVRPVPIRVAGLDEVFGKSHVVVHPSVADGFGYVVAEAMAAGVPVIASHTTGGSDWIEEGTNGWVVPAGDLAALRERLAWCHAHASQLPALGAAARRTAARHGLPAFRAEYLPLIRRLAESA